MRLRCALLAVALLARPAAGHGVPEATRRLDNGVMLYNMGDIPSARLEFAAAQAIDPQRAEPYLWLGWSDLKMRRCQSAVANFDKFLELAPRRDARAEETRTARARCRSFLDGGKFTVNDLAGPRSAVPDTSPGDRRKTWMLVGIASAGAIAIAAGIAIGVAATQPSVPYSTLGGPYNIVFQ